MDFAINRQEMGSTAVTSTTRPGRKVCILLYRSLDAWRILEFHLYSIDGQRIFRHSGKELILVFSRCESN